MSQTLSLGRRATHVLLALASFALISRAVGCFPPWPAESGLRTKMRAFEQHRDEFEGLFLGSSHVFRTFAPVVVDAELERLGKPQRSFNLGLDGMSSFEADHLLRRILDLEPARLRWVVLEPDNWSVDRAEDAAFSARAAYWHTPRETWGVLQCLREMDLPVRRRLELACDHVRLMLRNLTSFGLGPKTVDAWLGADRVDPKLSREEVEAQRGFQSLDEILDMERAGVSWRPSPRERHRALRADRAGWEFSLGILRSGVAEVPPTPERARQLLGASADANALRAQIELLERHRVEPLYTVVPRLKTLNSRARLLLRAGVIPRLLDFNDPDAYPEFFRFGLWFDLNHLGEAGAHLVSRAFAAELAAADEPR